jgi:hypothetical protein
MDNMGVLMLLLLLFTSSTLAFRLEEKGKANNLRISILAILNSNY